MQVIARSTGSLPVVSSSSPGRKATGAALKRKCTVTGLLPALLRREALQYLDVLGLAQPLGRRVRRRRMDVERRGVGHRHGARKAAHLGQFVAGEGRLLGPAPADHVDIGERCRRDRLGRRRHDVALGHLLGVLGQQAGDVERHVAVADHRHALHLRQIGPLAKVGMAVQPGHEPPRAPDQRLGLAWNAELAVDHHPCGHDHRVVACPYLVPGEVAADLEVAGKTHVGLGQQPVELARDGLGALMVRCHARPHQPMRRRQAFDQVDVEVRTGAQQPVGGIEAGRTGAHDGNPMSHDGPLSI